MAEEAESRCDYCQWPGKPEAAAIVANGQGSRKPLRLLPMVREARSRCDCCQRLGKPKAAAIIANG